MTAASESHSGVSIGDAVAGSSFDCDLDRVGEVTERVAQHREHVGTGLAGQRADVDLEVDAVGDHVGLRAAVRDGRRERRVRARVPTGAPSPSGSSSQRVVELVGIEERGGELGLEVACPR